MAERTRTVELMSPSTLPKGISRCWQYNGFHVYGAGPCFDTLQQAAAYKASLDEEGVRWRPQPR